jgi:glycosyltransferase involved in cell wall biosynthesis
MTILFISHVNPVLRAAGNEIRILKMIEWFRSKGAHIVLLLNLPPLSGNIRSKLLEIVDSVYTPDECPVSVPRKLRNAVNRIVFPPPANMTEAEQVQTYLGRPYLIQATGVLARRYRPQVVIAEYVFAAPCFREVPRGVFKVVDTHDLLSGRDPGESIYCTPEEERKYLLNADAIIAIQEAEAEMFRSLVPEREVITVGIDYEVVEDGDSYEECKDTVLVVGSNYRANITGLQSFCEHAWPLVCRENPQAELLVAGKICEAPLNGVPRVKTLGWVDDLQALYRQCSVVINPTLTGTGLKIKTVEALCNGKPLVATPNAVEGLPSTGDTPWVVGEDWQAFAGAVVSVLGDEKRRRLLQKTAIHYAREKFNSNTVYAQLAEILRSRFQNSTFGSNAR